MVGLLAGFLIALVMIALWERLQTWRRRRRMSRDIEHISQRYYY
jgi:hypothetical protein